MAGLLSYQRHSRSASRNYGSFLPWSRLKYKTQSSSKASRVASSRNSVLNSSKAIAQNVNIGVMTARTQSGSETLDVDKHTVVTINDNYIDLTAHELEEIDRVSELSDSTNVDDIILVTEVLKPGKGVLAMPIAIDEPFDLMPPEDEGISYDSRAIETTSSLSQFIHMRVYCDEMHFFLSAIYANPKGHIQTTLWKELQKLSRQITEPCLIKGDLKALMFDVSNKEEKKMRLQRVQQLRILFFPE
ncbi:unnamed protein product [Dovyalis caffra]|uniref:Uncharacterized protein n=1 Tax=Dovyalis caffra TaxID=77055 RepID=A0AAV1R1T5_9ROSI|nr:unnamed protein product [Dovyalis caffra]